MTIDPRIAAAVNGANGEAEAGEPANPHREALPGKLSPFASQSPFPFIGLPELCFLHERESAHSVHTSG